MDNHRSHPTPYPDVNAVLHALLSGMQAILGDRFVGLYLYGSLASGDFDPQTSDIDFVVVTAGEIPEELIPALEELHQQLWAGGGHWAAKLEGAYIPQEALRSYHPNDPPRPTVNEGRFYLDRQDSAWIFQRHILREQGVRVAGPPLRRMIDPVSAQDLQHAVKSILREWWLPMLENPARLQSAEYQAYAILSMCRALYTLRYGEIVSKRAAARWALGNLGERWKALIEKASAWQPGMDFSALDETLNFIRFTLSASQALV